jgi:hypothetical protein
MNTPGGRPSRHSSRTGGFDPVRVLDRLRLANSLLVPMLGLALIVLSFAGARDDAFAIGFLGGFLTLLIGSFLAFHAVSALRQPGVRRPRDHPAAAIGLTLAFFVGHFGLAVFLLALAPSEQEADIVVLLLLWPATALMLWWCLTAVRWRRLRWLTT